MERFGDWMHKIVSKAYNRLSSLFEPDLFLCRTFVRRQGKHQSAIMIIYSSIGGFAV